MSSESYFNDEVRYASAKQLAQAIRTKQISSEALTRAYLARIATINPQINAVVQLVADQALTQAQAADKALAMGTIWGPLHGVPFTIKDSFDTAGIISTWGTIGRRQFVPDQDATVVKRLKAAGAILLGKTNTPELTLSYETDNRVYGLTRNPHDLDRMPGGSSGGAAAIVAAGGSAFDIGSDTGGSIRIPAAFSGVCGLKPTTGRVPRTGHCPPPGGPFDQLTTIGPLARSVADLAFLLPLIAGPDGRDPYIMPVPWRTPDEQSIQNLRVAFYTNNGIYPAERAVSQVVEKAALLLRNEGARVGEKRPPLLEKSQLLLGALMRGWDGGAWVRLMLARAGTAEEESSLSRYLEAGTMSPAEIIELHDQIDQFRIKMLTFLDKVDVILSPVTAYPALKNGELSEKYMGCSYTMTYNLTGWPAAVIPAGVSPEGLPIGLQIVAGPWREDLVLTVAAKLEEQLQIKLRPAI